MVDIRKYSYCRNSRSCSDGYILLLTMKANIVIVKMMAEKENIHREPKEIFFLFIKMFNGISLNWDKWRIPLTTTLSVRFIIFSLFHFLCVYQNAGSFVLIRDSDDRMCGNSLWIYQMILDFDTVIIQFTERALNRTNVDNAFI